MKRGISITQIFSNWQIEIVIKPSYEIELLSYQLSYQTELLSYQLSYQTGLLTLSN